MPNQEFENKFGLNYGNTTHLQTFGPQHENTGQQGSEQGLYALAKRIEYNEVAKSPSVDNCKQGII